MKKMIVALAIAMIAFTAQAAVLNWQTYPVDVNGNALESGVSYLIQVTDTENFAVSSNLGITGGEIVDSAANEGFTVGSWTTESLAGGSHWFAILVTTDGVAGTAGEFTLPTTGSYVLDGLYSVDWNASTGGDLISTTLTDGTVLTVNQTVGGTTPPEDDPTIPEPTVLALLALGAAGLALKRKVA